MKCAKKVAVWKSGIIEVDLYTASFIYVNLSPLPEITTQLAVDYLPVLKRRGAQSAH